MLNKINQGFMLAAQITYEICSWDRVSFGEFEEYVQGFVKSSTLLNYVLPVSAMYEEWGMCIPRLPYQLFVNHFHCMKSF